MQFRYQQRNDRDVSNLLVGSVLSTNTFESDYKFSMLKYKTETERARFRSYRCDCVGNPFFENILMFIQRNLPCIRLLCSSLCVNGRQIVSAFNWCGRSTVEQTAVFKLNCIHFNRHSLGSLEMFSNLKSKISQMKKMTEWVFLLNSLLDQLLLIFVCERGCIKRSRH